jgi:hypothetical protein
MQIGRTSMPIDAASVPTAAIFDMIGPLSGVIFATTP